MNFKFLLMLLLFMGQLEAKVEKAIFAGGCFWCMEPPFDKTIGVLSTISGYIGGELKNPTYEQVSSGRTGHLEAVEVTFNSDKVSYQELLKIFWKNIDPYDGSGQFCDKGEQYTSAIFYLNENQKELALASKKNIKGKEVRTKILPATTFYPAEEYHQDYYTKNPLRYKYYRHSCGRDERLKELWGK